jgi:hypothetical protein
MSLCLPSFCLLLLWLWLLLLLLLRGRDAPAFPSVVVVYVKKWVVALSIFIFDM